MPPGALDGHVVVLTGASSGLGRAAAVELVRRGAVVVLAARRRGALEATAADCRALGGAAVCVPTDVTVPAEVEQLKDAALAVRGRIDAWINNAGVTLFALLEDAPLEAHRRVIETNLFGALYGARAVVPIFRRQRRGVLVNVSSLLGEIGQPYVPSYVVSKFAVRGLTEALRAELADEPDVHACTLLPYAIDTPHFESGANWMGRPTRAMPPAQSPETVARVLADLIEHPVRRRRVPRVAALGLVLHALLPRTTEKLLLHALRRWHFGDGHASRTDGNLHAPDGSPATVQGTRPPQLSTFGLVGWLAWHAGEILLGSSRPPTPRA